MCSGYSIPTAGVGLPPACRLLGCRVSPAGSVGASQPAAERCPLDTRAPDLPGLLAPGLAREQAPWTLALRAIHVIVRSAHSALVRKLCNPRRRAAGVGLPPKPARAARPDLAREQAPWTFALRAIRVIVRSAHSALARKLCNPQSLFIIYDPSVCLRRCAAPVTIVKTASSECSV